MSDETVTQPKQNFWTRKKLEAAGAVFSLTAAGAAYYVAQQQNTRPLPDTVTWPSGPQADGRVEKGGHIQFPAALMPENGVDLTDYKAVAEALGKKLDGTSTQPIYQITLTHADGRKPQPYQVTKQNIGTFAGMIRDAEALTLAESLTAKSDQAQNKTR